ncbi:bifunctional shikimate kinase/3-dehydroquinate synthase [Myxococcota bacterium]|nr:bifunctional shikimate kinase/3-dehydroquinate synthase [Myxococcota bacterium]
MSAEVLLSGPPGVGKSTVGRALAARLGVPAVDLDDVVEARTHESPAAILRSRGEAALRDAEADALTTLPSAPRVLALGGGTLTTARGRRAARARGKLLGLVAQTDVLEARLATSGVDRPLLDAPGALAQLLDARRTSYAAVDRTVDASSVIDDVAARAASGAAELELLFADVGGARSRILVGTGLEDALTGAVAALAPTRPVLVILDRGVPADVRARYVAKLEALFPVHAIEVEGGERVKRWAFAGELLERAAEAGCGRQSAVVAIGGGATCDVAALVASLLGRGAPVVLVPSTLLAQVDASVGGKCAVNLDAGRNLAGTFHAATDVLVDAAMLASLPEREYRSGLAELLKIAIIADPALFDEVVGLGAARVGTRHVARAIAHKAAIVARDPFERGERRVLNLGHTLGHALEAASDFAVPHGEAVAIGIAAVARFSVARGWLAQAELARIVGGLEAVGLPVEAPEDLLGRSAAFLAQDKKADAAGLELVGVQELGKVSVMRVSFQELAGLVSSGRTSTRVAAQASHVPWVGGKA